jgi:hypothetical protein
VSVADHDQRFKTLLQTRFADLLRLVLGDEDAARYDCARVEWLGQEIYPDPPEGQRLVIDLVAKLPVREAVNPQQAREPEPWLMLIHAEIESEDRVAPLRKRIYDYRHELRRKYDLPVLSLGVYLAVALEGFGWDTYVETYHGQEIVRFRYPYIGLPGLDAEQYVRGDNPLGTALVGLMRLPQDRQADLKAEAMERIATSNVPELHRYLLAECLDAYLPLEEPHLARYEHLLRTEKKYGEAMKIGKTSRELGREDLLIETMQRKFGTLPPGIESRVRSMKPDELIDLNLRIGTANTLRDLGLEPDPGNEA